MTKQQFSSNPSVLRVSLQAAFAVVCLAAALAGDAARLGLRYERAAIEAGEWWRFLTAHIVHLGIAHTVLNLLGFGLVTALFSGDLNGKDWLGAGLVSAVAIGLGLYFIDPQTTWYVGLSGVLHGWFAIGAARVAEQQRAFGLTLLALLTCKLGFEQFLGTMPVTAALDVGPVVVEAHLYGALGALLFYVTSRAFMLAARSRRSL